MIHHRDAFLNNVAKQLGRSRNTTVKPERNWQFRPQDKTLTNKTPDELMTIFRDQCRLIHTELIETTGEKLADVLEATVNLYGGGPISLWDDPRYTEFGLASLIDETWPSRRVDVHKWDAEQGKENIARAEQANVGITFSDMTLAESGTVVLFSSTGKGRTVSLLPKQYIAIIPKSTIVPRMTQAAQEISRRVQAGETIPSCINFVTGPSNSADIEMNLVVGVHGPVKAAYIVVEDR
ncbi:LutC/YkgG family protein [Domibacillus enclensis]|uniref:Lactate utilization protein C n=1 Tax=Domibacillus enclensis TaxID=1017273 RepID=A0A1N6Y7U3_9BACI|nr:lactate utilization protein C [Domibacillus enclensis]OXS77548.1 lactate utilization protein C [Domibacillus enclensis]SIR10692.1 L-lactate dehydrogenase complex protein LldG [Domibacillus enclensis]